MPRLPLLKAGIHLRTTQDTKKTDNRQKTEETSRAEGRECRRNANTIRSRPPYHARTSFRLLIAGEKEVGAYLIIRQNNTKDEIGALSTSQGQDED